MPEAETPRVLWQIPYPSNLPGSLARFELLLQAPGWKITDIAITAEKIADIQKKLAGHVYAIPMPGTATTFTMAWPALGNFGVFRGSAIPNWGLWVDQTKAPFV